MLELLFSASNLLPISAGLISVVTAIVTAVLEVQNRKEGKDITQSKGTRKITDEEIALLLDEHYRSNDDACEVELVQLLAERKQLEMLLKKNLDEIQKKQLETSQATAQYTVPCTPSMNVNLKDNSTDNKQDSGNE